MKYTLFFELDNLKPEQADYLKTHNYIREDDYGWGNWMIDLEVSKSNNFVEIDADYLSVANVTADSAEIYLHGKNSENHSYYIGNAELKKIGTVSIGVFQLDSGLSLEHYPRIFSIQPIDLSENNNYEENETSLWDVKSVSPSPIKGVNDSAQFFNDWLLDNLDNLDNQSVLDQSVLGSITFHITADTSIISIADENVNPEVLYQANEISQQLKNAFQEHVGAITKIEAGDQGDIPAKKLYLRERMNRITANNRITHQDIQNFILVCQDMPEYKGQSKENILAKFGFEKVSLKQFALNYLKAEEDRQKANITSSKNVAWMAYFQPEPEVYFAALKDILENPEQDFIQLDNESEKIVQKIMETYYEDNELMSPSIEAFRGCLKNENGIRTFGFVNPK